MYDLSWSWKDNFRAKHNSLMRILKKYDLGLVFLPNFPVPLDYSAAANTVTASATDSKKTYYKNKNKDDGGDINDDDFGGVASMSSKMKTPGAMFPNAPAGTQHQVPLMSPSTNMLVSPASAMTGTASTMTISPSSASTMMHGQVPTASLVAETTINAATATASAARMSSSNSQYEISPLQNLVDPIPASAAAYVYKIIPLNSNGETLLREFAEKYAGAKEIQKQQRATQAFSSPMRNTQDRVGAENEKNNGNNGNDDDQIVNGHDDENDDNNTEKSSEKKSSGKNNHKPAPIQDPVELAKEERKARAKTIVAVEYNVKTSWNPYDAQYTEQIITAWIEGNPTFSYFVHGTTYVVDLVRFTQTNQKTGTRRSIRFLFRRPYSFSERDTVPDKMPAWVAETLDDIEKITKGNRQHSIVAAAGVALPQLYLIDISVNIARLAQEHPLRLNYATGKFFSDWPTIPLWDPITQTITRVERDYTLPLVEERKRALHRQTERLLNRRNRIISSGAGAGADGAGARRPET